MQDDMVCGKCKMPMLVVRTDGIPFCANCEKKVRHSAAKMLETRKGREGRPKISMKEWRYVPG